MPYALHTSSRLPFPLLAGLSFVALTVAIPARADAQVCASNSACPAGTTCQQTSVPSAEPGCAGPDCPVTGTGGATGKVAPDAVIMTCAPAPCQVDSDCGGQMICHTQTSSVCSGGTPTACGRDMKCEAVPPPTCTETRVSTCAYKWQQPCSADADCGAGFTCEPNMITSCSGGGVVPVSGTGTANSGSSGSAPARAGGSSGSSEPSDAPTRVDGGTTEMCTTTTSFPGWCRPKDSTCTVDADCPTAWTCVDGNATDVGSGSSGSGSAGVTQPTTTETGSAPPPATTLASVKVCQPPISFPVRGSVATDVGAPKSPAGNGGLTSGPGSGPPEVATQGSNAGCTIAGVSTSPLAAFAVLMLGLALATRRRARSGTDRE